MLIHPQFDPVAIHVGPLAIRWYGLMYLLGFALFIVLGKLRARRNLLTGWHPRDVDDMLFYGVIGVIAGWVTCCSTSRCITSGTRSRSSNCGRAA
jgi:phosphatidylglycerol:prolipoprotein diacylglycerol transferase